MTTIRIVLALSAHERWPVFQMDVKSTFLNGDLKEKVYVSQPPNFVVPGKEEYVYRLFKALYGLKQAPRVWNEKMDQYLKKLGFIRSHTDYNLYYKSDGGLLCVLVLYVDYLTITGNDLLLVEQIKAALCQRFEMTGLGILHFFLGLEIQQTPGGMFIS